MSILTGSIEELMTPRLIERLSASTGVPGAKVRTGMNGAVASILDGLAGKARDTRAMGQFADLVKNTPGTDTPEAFISDDSALQRSSSQLFGLVGADSQSLASRLGRYAGVGGGAAAGLVGAAVAVVMGAFRKLGRARGGLDGTALSSTLLDEERAIHAAVPAGMLNGATHGANVIASRPIVQRPEGYVHRAETVEPVGHAERGRWWLLPLILLAGLLVALALWGGRRHRAVQNVRLPGVTHEMRQPRPEPPPTTTEGRPAPMAPAVTPQQAPTEQQPPSAAAQQLKFATGTPEQQLLDSARTPSATPPWIDLDVSFQTGQATVQPGAADQLANIAKVLAAYPNAKLRVGGYTDAVGTTEANQRLSQDRADAVKQELVARGVDPTRIEAKGYGEAHPVAPGTKQKANRRAAIQLISE